MPALVISQQAFTEVSAEAGINHYFEVNLATFGGGAAVIDFDNDGWEDLYVTGGNSADAFFKNNGDGTFTNIIEGAGFERTMGMYTQGVAAADVNKDGWKDIIVTTMYYLTINRELAPNLLYINQGDGTFKDATQAWGLEAFLGNSQGATFGDINADGYPDLYVSNYFSAPPTGVSIFNEQTITNSFNAVEDFLLLNAGGRGFIDGADIYNMEHDGFGFQGIFTDFDNDRDLDLHIANDFGFKRTPNIMLENKFPEKRFFDRSLNLGLNYGMNAMGIAAGDFDFDGWMDYFVTNLGASLLTRNSQNYGPFFNESVLSGLAIPVISDSIYTGPPISWGANFFDFDHDTDLDLFVCNGALNPTIRVNPNFFFECDDNLQYTEIAAEKGMADYRIGRGSVVFDYDNDGDLDLFVVNQKPRDPSPFIPEARCLLYRNDGVTGNWLKVELQGTYADKNGLGARIEVALPGKTLIREIEGGASHLSQNSTIAHFGLADVEKVSSITVSWIGGKTQTIENVAVNQKLTIVESDEPTYAFDANYLKVYPGSFSDYVIIEYELEEAESLTVEVLDMQGRLVASIAQMDDPGLTGLLQWEAESSLPKGTYIIRMSTPNEVTSRRVVKL